MLAVSSPSLMQSRDAKLVYLDCRGKRLDLATPKIMGILNLSPHSFSEIGRATSLELAIKHALHLVAAGADIIDIGAEPTHPANEQVVTEDEELERLLPVVDALVNTVDVPISVDTSRPKVMHAVVNAGAHMINDVRALQVPGALEIAAELSVPICLMHMRYLRMPDANPTTLDRTDTTLSIIDEIQQFLTARIQAAEAAGISRNRIVIDPGIGGGCFGKNMQENLLILRHLEELQHFNLPILVGMSRKLFLGELLTIPPSERLAASLAAALAAAMRGANIIRVHDVAETVQAMKVLHAIEGVLH